MPGFVLEYLQISVTMGFLVLLLKLFSQRINRTFDARLKYWAWLLIAVRLLIPFGIPIPQRPVVLPLPAAAYEAGPALETTGLPAAQGMKTGAAGPAALPLETVLLAVWLAGFVTYTAYHLLRYHGSKRRLLRWSAPLKDETLLARIEMERYVLRIASPVEVYVCKKVESPVMVGFVRPRLLLPKAMLSLPPADTAFILRHEMIHLKRNDLWYKLLVMLSTAAHWFNPAMHLMFREASADLEISCDARVVQGGDMRARAAYFETMLGYISQRRREATLSTHFNGGTRMMEHRFKALMSGCARKRGIAVFVALLLAVTMTGSLFGATYAAEDAAGEQVVKAWLEAYGDELRTGWRKDAFAPDLTDEDLPLEDVLLIAGETVSKAAGIEWEALASYEPSVSFITYVDGRREWQTYLSLKFPDDVHIEERYTVTIDSLTGNVLFYMNGGRG